VSAGYRKPGKRWHRWAWTSGNARSTSRFPYCLLARRRRDILIVERAVPSGTTAFCRIGCTRSWCSSNCGSRSRRSSCSTHPHPPSLVQTRDYRLRIWPLFYLLQCLAPYNLPTWPCCIPVQSSINSSPHSFSPGWLGSRRSGIPARRSRSTVAQSHQPELSTGRSLLAGLCDPPRSGSQPRTTHLGIP